MTASACPARSAIPLPGVSVRVTDPETGKELARDTIGMIEVKGPNVFKGYWRMPEKTKAEFRDDGFFITGDLGKIDDKGYVHILGRGKDLVISGGFNVYPKEIESEIDAMPGVIESAVIGVPHADFGEGVTAVVVCNKGADVSEASVLKALDGRLAKFKMPKRVFVVDELPRNAMGKVQKNILRDTYAKIYSRIAHAVTYPLIMDGRTVSRSQSSCERVPPYCAAARRLKCANTPRTRFNRIIVFRA